MLLTRLLVPWLALFCALPAIAGMERESHSTHGGLFFALLPPDAERVMARFDDKAQLQRLVQHCNADKAVFALQGGVKYRCKAEVFKTQSGADDWDVTVRGAARRDGARLARTVAGRVAAGAVVGAGALFFGEAAHGDHRDEDDQYHRQVAQEGSNHQVVEIELRLHLRLPEAGVELHVEVETIQKVEEEPAA